MSEVRWAVRFLLAVVSLSVTVSPASAQSCRAMTIDECIDYYWMSTSTFTNDEVSEVPWIPE